MNNFLRDLQNKPYETRIKILWSVTGIVAVVLIAIWAITLKTTIKETGSVDLTSRETESRGSQAKINVIKIERVEKNDEGLKIFFNIKNNTDDILNFSKIENIVLKTDQETIKATAVLDRQGLPLVQKILSQTQIFGLLMFPVTSFTTPELTFNSMFFEKSPDRMLKQTLELELDSLIKNTEVRN